MVAMVTLWNATAEWNKNTSSWTVGVQDRCDGGIRYIGLSVSGTDLLKIDMIVYNVNS